MSLCNSVVLHIIPCRSDTFTLYTDASGAGVGGCLHITRDGKELPVAFFSRQLKKAEKNYSVTELEALAIVSSIRHFNYHLYGRPVTIITDHRACLALSSGSTLNKRLLRFALALQDREILIFHREGAKLGNANGLSRQSWTDEKEAAPEVLSASSPGFGLAGGDVWLTKR